MKRARQVILGIRVGGAAFSGVLPYEEVFGHSAADGGIVIGQALRECEGLLTATSVTRAKGERP